MLHYVSGVTTIPQFHINSKPRILHIIIRSLNSEEIFEFIKKDIQIPIKENVVKYELCSRNKLLSSENRSQEKGFRYIYNIEAYFTDLNLRVDENLIFIPFDIYIMQSIYEIKLELIKANFQDVVNKTKELLICSDLFKQSVYTMRKDRNSYYFILTEEYSNIFFFNSDMIEIKGIIKNI